MLFYSEDVAMIWLFSEFKLDEIMPLDDRIIVTPSFSPKAVLLFWLFPVLIHVDLLSFEPKICAECEDC